MDVFSSLSHYFGALVALCCAPGLLRHAGEDRRKRIATLVFTSSVVVLLICSGNFHAATRGTEVRRILNHFDHASIFLVFAGGFTPVHMIVFKNRWGRERFLALVWAICLCGFVGKVAFYSHISKTATVLVFVCLTALSLVSMGGVAKACGLRSARYPLLGMFAFLFGGSMWTFKWPSPEALGIEYDFLHHDLWHVFVLVALFAHWRFVHEYAIGYAEPTQGGAEPPQESDPKTPTGG